MSLSSHVRCDRCEAVIRVADADGVLDEGWLVVEFGDEARDFCTLGCLARWAGSDEACEVVEQAALREDEE